MYKSFKAGNAQILCNALNKEKMRIHTLDYKNGSFNCIGTPCDYEQELRCHQGPANVVTKAMNTYEREPEYLALKSHWAACFYRHDDAKEKETAARLKAEEDKRKEEEYQADKDAKMKALEDKKKALEQEMKELDSDKDSESEADKEAKEKADKEAKEKADKEAKEKADKAAADKKKGK